MVAYYHILPIHRVLIHSVNREHRVHSEQTAVTMFLCSSFLKVWLLPDLLLARLRKRNTYFCFFFLCCIIKLIKVSLASSNDLHETICYQSSSTRQSTWPWDKEGSSTGKDAVQLPHEVCQRCKPSDQIRGNFDSVSLFSWSQVSPKTWISWAWMSPWGRWLVCWWFHRCLAILRIPIDFVRFCCAVDSDQDRQNQTHLPLLYLPSLQQFYSSDKLFPFPLISLTHSLNLHTVKKCLPE